MVRPRHMSPPTESRHDVAGDDVPDHFGPYEVLEPIGSGAMGVVYRGRDPRMNREVAIKVLGASGAVGSSSGERFQQEARAAGALNHPNLLTVYDVGKDGDRHYLVSELLQGQTLRAVLAGGPLPLRKAVDLAGQLARGVAAAHEAGVVHRDLKPANLFVTERGQLKVLDFGIAKLENRDRRVETANETLAEHTSEGTILGTSGYMAPEQIQGKAADSRCDIFSFGIILFEMIAGRPPFEGSTLVDVAYATLRDEAPALPNAPADLQRIAARCLEKDPAERFQSARDLAFALDLATITPVENRAVRSRRPGLVGGVALATAAVAASVAAVWTLRPAAPAAVRSEVIGGFEGLEQLTFRRGGIRTARFGPEGAGALYAAEWSGDPLQTFQVLPGSRDSRALGHAGALLLDVSSTGELALLVGERSGFGPTHAGTLAVAPMGSGGAREVRDHVVEADFAPHGSEIAAVVLDDRKQSQLEYPLGKGLVRSAGYLSHVRISPDGERVAYIDHPARTDDRGTVAVVDRNGHATTLTPLLGSAQGLAWSPSGDEVWFSAAPEGTLRSLWAVNLAGEMRSLAQSPATLTLHDVAADGRVLLTRDDSRVTLHRKRRGEPEEDLSWFDWSLLMDASPSGERLYFLEGGAAAGAQYALYERSEKGEPATRLATDVHIPATLSPDGKWLAAAADAGRTSIKLVPTGTGDVRAIELPGRQELVWSWFPDSQSLLVHGAGPSAKDARVWRLDVAKGTLEEQDWALGYGLFGYSAIGPQGQMLLIDRRTKAAWLRDPAGQMRELGMKDDLQTPVSWSLDGSTLTLQTLRGSSIRVSEYDLRTGDRREVEALHLGDTAGVEAVLSLDAAGDAVAYSALRTLSTLYQGRVRGA